MSEDILIPGCQGIVRTSDVAEHEKGTPDTLFRGDNICMDFQQNVYVVTGYTPLSAVIGTGVLSNLYYSSAIRVLLCTDSSGELFRINTSTGAVTSVSAGLFGAGVTLSYADWETAGANNRVLISDGVVYADLDSAFTFTNNSAGAPLGIAPILQVHKNTVWAIGGGSQRNRIIPSTADDYLTFSTTNALRLIEGGDRINAAWSAGGVLYCGKQNTIWGVYGDSFTGDSKDVAEVDLATGRGPIKQNAVFVDTQNVYMVCRDGFYIFPLSGGYEKISRPIDTLLREVWYFQPNNARVTRFEPVGGPDHGQVYIIFMFQDDNQNLWHVWRYNRELKSWTKETDFPIAINDIVQSPDNLRTYLAADKIYFYDNVPQRASSDISGNMVINPITAGNAAAFKQFEWLFPLMTELPSTKVYAGWDGLYPLYDLANHIDSANLNTTAELPLHNMGGSFGQFRFQRTGGGELLFNSAYLQLTTQAPNQRRNSEYSRREAVDFFMTYAPPIKVGSQTTTNLVTTYTITHGLGEWPEAIICCHAGYNMAGVLTVTNVTRTTFDIVCPSNPGASKTLYWMVVAPGKRLFDSYFRGKYDRTITTSVRTLNHNLGQTPTAVLITKASNSGLGLTVSGLNSRQVTLTPEAAAVSSSYYCGVFKHGTTDTYFKCGSASSSPISHGLGATPSAAFIYPNSAPLPSHGITSVSSTQIVYSGTGNYYWMAVK